MLQAMAPPPFEPDGRNKAYVGWLVEQSMLGDARTLARQLAGQHTMWANPFASPDPPAAGDRAARCAGRCACAGPCGAPRGCSQAGQRARARGGR